jgi:hypothetical protein
MKRICLILLVLSFAAIMLFCSGSFAEEKNKSQAAADGPELRHGSFELPAERVDRIINRLKQTDPEKAKELEKLRTEDPEKFKAELRETMRAEFAKEISRYNRREIQKDVDQGVRQSVWIEGQIDKTNDQMSRRLDEYLEWLRNNYPEEAEVLAETKEKEPDTYRERLRLSLGKYGRIAEASKNNPQLATVLKEDLELKEHAEKLLEEFRTTSDEDKKKKLGKELEQVIGSRYDLSVKKKQIKHEQLLKKLEELRQKVKESEADIQKWIDAKFKNEKVNAAVEGLTTGKEQLKWD